jgi:hypothetical protein
MKTHQTKNEAMFTWIDVAVLFLALIVLGFSS